MTISDETLALIAKDLFITAAARSVDHGLRPSLRASSEIIAEEFTRFIQLLSKNLRGDTAS